MYAKNDPRAALNTASASPAATEFVPASYGKFYETAPQEERDGGRFWYHRAQNFIVVYVEVSGELSLERSGQPDEWVVLVPDDGTLNVELRAGGDTKATRAASMLVVPPGDSRMTARGQGRLTLLFTTRSPDLCAKCANAAEYAQAHPNIPPFVPWPDPPAGFALRLYPLNVPPEGGRFGCIYRCTTFMVNAFEVKPPRDVTTLSPHLHEDFEQCSLALDGAYIHHIRWPWVSDSTKWIDDHHEHCASPSVAIIPPPSLHTSQGISADGNRLFDIFSPPRRDFSEKPGWVLNAADYPMP